MFKIYTKFRKRDWWIILLIVLLTILQVYCTMLMVDYISGMITAIEYVNAHNSANELLSIFSNALSNQPGGDSFLFTLTGLIRPHVQNDVIVWDQLMTDSSFQAFLSVLPKEIGDMFTTISKAGPGDIWIEGGMMVLVAAGIMGCQIVIEVAASYVTANLATKVRKELNEKISNFSLAEIKHFTPASLITRTTNDVQQVSMCTLLVLRMIFAAPVTAIWAICKIQAASWELTLSTAITIVVLVLALVVIMCLVLPIFKTMQKKIDRINSLMQENLTGIRVVRAYNAESYQEEKFKKSNNDLTKAQLFTGRILALLSPIMMILMNVLTLAIYWIGAYLMNGETNLNYANVSAFSSLATQIVMSFMMLLMMFVMWPRASVSAKRINEVLECPLSIQDPINPMTPKETGTVVFDDVSFRYPDAEEDVLEHISFVANQGDTIAFIGSTGSGKSSLVNLVARLYDVTEGHVYIDGVDIRNLTQVDLRKRIGFVPQQGLLFSGTVRSNLSLGAEGEYNDEECLRALKIASADSFVSEMEGGIDASIAQGGTNVSGGQRQRLCIARAVAIKPEIFVFDDSFSALDFKTDKTVRENLAREEKNATKLIVAQRIGTIMDADCILVLQEGKVVGKGTHKELLKTCEIYRDIALSQMSKEELGL